jgi:hypothetical protein
VRLRLPSLLCVNSKLGGSRVVINAPPFVLPCVS